VNSLSDPLPAMISRLITYGEDIGDMLDLTGTPRDAMNAIGKLLSNNQDTIENADGTYNLDAILELLPKYNENGYTDEVAKFTQMIQAYKNTEGTTTDVGSIIQKATEAVDAGNYAEAFSLYDDLKANMSELSSLLNPED